jgi:hypothetical protein
MTVHTIFTAPTPILVGAVVPQVIPPEVMNGLPGWAATFILGVWVVGWWLDRTGKLPGAEATPDYRLVQLLESLNTKVDDLSKAVTDLRIELAKKN